MSHFRLIVCGGRDYTDSDRVAQVLESILKRKFSMTVIHGGAPGADTLASNWRKRRAILRDCALNEEAFPADWKTHGKRAGPLRNQAMVDSGADGCVAFPGGRGTADMIGRCRKAWIPVWEIS